MLALARDRRAPAPRAVQSAVRDHSLPRRAPCMSLAALCRSLRALPPRARGGRTAPICQIVESAVLVPKTQMANSAKQWPAWPWVGWPQHCRLLPRPRLKRRRIMHEFMFNRLQPAVLLVEYTHESSPYSLQSVSGVSRLRIVNAAMSQRIAPCRSCDHTAVHNAAATCVIRRCPMASALLTTHQYTRL